MNNLLDGPCQAEIDKMPGLVDALQQKADFSNSPERRDSTICRPEGTLAGQSGPGGSWQQEDSGRGRGKLQALQVSCCTRGAHEVEASPSNVVWCDLGKCWENSAAPLT